jgi:hypothetical protein
MDFILGLLKMLFNVLQIILKRITKSIIEHKVRKTAPSLLREIANEFHKTQKFEIQGKGPQFIYDNSMQLIEIKQGETPYRHQSFQFNFGIVEKVYHRTWITQFLGIDEEIEERSFEQLLKSGKLHEGNERHTFIFKKIDNPDFF